MTKHLRTVECVEWEERLLDGTPAGAALLLADEQQSHLGSCPSCGGLAADLAALCSLPAVDAPEPVVAAAIAAATAEVRAVRIEARRAMRRAALQIAAIAAVCLPLSLAWAMTVWHLGASFLGPALPPPLASLLGISFSLVCLAALSALAFTLTLLAGAAARPPREALLLEV